MRIVIGLLTCVATALLCASSAVAQVSCSCPFQGDLNNDGFPDAVDLNLLRNAIFFAGPDAHDPLCPASRGDLNSDGFVDIIDLEWLADMLFVGGPPPLDPCIDCWPCSRPVGIGTGSVFVESKSVPIGLPDSVGVYLTNSTALAALMIPLMVREIDTYPTALDMQYRADGRFVAQFESPSAYAHVTGFDMMNGDCAGGPGSGFEDPGGVGLSSPDALQFGFVSLPIFPTTLAAGSDGAVPSLQILFTAPTTTGVFEIDTTCSTPNNHLAFIEPDTHGEIIPTFTKGTITVDCDCPYQGDFDESGFLDAIDLNELINTLFFNGPDPRDALCATTRADFDNSGFADALDLNGLIDHLFFSGEGPCDPCNPVQGTCAP